LRITLTGIASSIASSGGFALKRLHKSAGRQRWKNFRRDASADKHAAGRDRAQTEVTGFRTVRLYEQIERFDAAGTALFQAAVVIAAAAAGSSRSFTALQRHVAVRHLMNVQQAAA
jgi:hypothetical protein